jgi:hypothetical protein
MISSVSIKKKRMDKLAEGEKIREEQLWHWNIEDFIRYITIIVETNRKDTYGVIFHIW